VTYGLEFHSPHLIIQGWLRELGTRGGDMRKVLGGRRKQIPKGRIVRKTFSNCTDFSYTLLRVSISSF